MDVIGVLHTTEKVYSMAAGLPVLFGLTCLVVVSSTFPIAAQLSYFSHKPLGMQTLVDHMSKDILRMEAANMYIFLGNLSITVLWGQVHLGLAMALTYLFYMTLIAMLVQIGLQFVMTFTVIFHGIMLHDISENTIVTCLRLANILITSIEVFHDLNFEDYKNNPTYQRLVHGSRSWTGQGSWKPVAVIVTAITDIVVFALCHGWLNLKVRRQQQPDNEQNRKSICQELRNVITLGTSQHEGDAENPLANVEYNMVSFRTMSLFVALGHSFIMAFVLVTMIVSPEEDWSLEIHIFVIFFFMFINNVMWIAKSPNMLAYVDRLIHRAWTFLFPDNI